MGETSGVGKAVAFRTFHPLCGVSPQRLFAKEAQRQGENVGKFEQMSRFLKFRSTESPGGLGIAIPVLYRLPVTVLIHVILSEATPLRIRVTLEMNATSAQRANKSVPFQLLPACKATSG